MAVHDVFGGPASIPKWEGAPIPVTQLPAVELKTLKAAPQSFARRKRSSTVGILPARETAP
jgi:hypothetical protein